MSSSSKSSSSKREREEDAKEKNRLEILERPRQWETVQSDEESDGGSDDENSSDSSEVIDEGDERRKKHRSEKKSKEKRSKHDKKSKKEKKSKDKKKKEKKEKKRKEKKSDSCGRSSSVAVDQNEFGKYGIIREQDYFYKQREFEVYMDEVKGMPGILGQSKREIMQYFKSFIEDFNTATMPHPKFYDYDRWEMEEYRRKQLQQSQPRTGEVQAVFDDESVRKAELKRQRELEEQKEFERLKSTMVHDTSLRESMRRQGELQTQLQQAHKRGDSETVKRLERLLAPDELKVTVKHPWA